jgi:hypothetical protein
MRKPSPRAMRLLGIGNVVLAVAFLVLSLVTDSPVGKVFGQGLMVLTLAIAVFWFRQERIARGRAEPQQD